MSFKLSNTTITRSVSDDIYNKNNSIAIGLGAGENQQNSQLVTFWKSVDHPQFHSNFFLYETNFFI